MRETQVVGRDDELARVAVAARRSTCMGVVLVGPAGVGKTSLAAAIADRLCADGSDHVRIAATQASVSIPLGAVAPLLAVAPAAGAEQADLIRHTVASLGLRAQRRRIAQPGARGLVVTVDDAQLLDEASALLVNQLAVAGHAFVIITVRAPLPVADPIISLWKDGHAERIDLEALGLPESTALATGVLGGPIHPGTATTLFDASGGNALFHQQLVANARDVGALTFVAGRGPVPGRWTLTGRLPLPDDLVAVVESRLEHLDDADRRIIELLAIGEPLGAALIEGLAGEGGEERLERLEADGFVVAANDGRRLDVRLAHPLFGEVLRATAPASWANRARIMLADALTAHGCRRDFDALRVATWRLAARAPIPIDIADQAARQALRRFDPGLAERIVRSRESGTERRPDDPESLMLLATIAARAPRGDETLELLDELERRLDGIEHDGRLRALGVILRFDVLAYVLGRFEEAFELRMPPDADESTGAELVGRQAVLAVSVAQPAFAATLMGGLPPVAPSPRASIWIELARAMLASAAGRTQDTLIHADRCETLLLAQPWDQALPEPGILWFVRVRALQQAGRLEDANALATEGADLEADRWSEQAVAWLRLAASSLHRLGGRLTAAAEAARASAATFERSGSVQLAGAALAELAAAHAAMGDASQAAAASQRCRDLGVAPFSALVAAAWTSVASMETSRGIEQLVALVARRRGRERREELLLVLDVVRLGGAALVVDRAQELSATTQGDLAPAIAAFAVAAAADDGSLLDDAASVLLELGLKLPAAEAAMLAAAAHRRAGDGRRSRAAGTQAAWLLAEVPDARTPALIPVEVHVALTVREREVAMLADHGHSSRSIATVLGLTPRTVESYLQAAYDKLGISGRTELAAVLRPS